MPRRPRQMETLCVESTPENSILLSNLGIRPSRMMIGAARGGDSSLRLVLTLAEQKILTDNNRSLTNIRQSQFEGIGLADIVEGKATSPTPVEIETPSPITDRERYMTVCMKRLKKNADFYSSQINAARKKIEQGRELCIEGYRELELGEAHFEKAKEIGDKAKEKFAKEFDALVAMPKVTRVMVNEQLIEVHTDTLYCTDPRSKVEHEIGKMRIVINYEKGSLLIFNKTRQVGSHHAPHVFSGGSLCAGNIEGTLRELFKSYEYAAIAQVAIQFVESVNVNDGAGQNIDHWPEAKRNKKVEATDKPKKRGRPKKTLVLADPHDDDDDDDAPF